MAGPVAVAELRGSAVRARMADAPVQDGLDLIAVVPRIEPQPRRAGGEPVKVGLQPEEPSLPDVHDVICAVRTGNPQIEHGDLRRLDRTVPPVDPGRPAWPRRSSRGASINPCRLAPPGFLLAADRGSNYVTGCAS